MATNLGVNVHFDGYIDVDVDIEDFEIDDIIEYLEDEGYKVNEEDELPPSESYAGISGDDLKRHLCDILEIGYHSDEAIIYQLISEKI